MAKRPNPECARPGYTKPGQLVEDEGFHIGKVDYEIYRYYLSRFGHAMFSLVLLGYGACRAFDLLSSVWISNWSEEVLQEGATNSTTAANGWRLTIYGLLGICQGTCIFFGTLILGLCGLAASSSLHDETLSRLVRAPMSFFDTTPLGRMLNRFSKDLDQADMQIAIVVDSLLEMLTDVLGILLLITIYIPSFMVAVLPCSVIYFIVQKLFVRTFRQLQRLESVSRSPVFNCIAETVPGVQTIRAYAVQRAFIALSDTLLERWISSAFHLMAAERWLTVRLNFLGTAVSLFTACLLVHGRDVFGPAAYGLTLLYALKVTDALNYLVRFMAELENSLIAVERLHEYTKTPTEAPWRVSPAPSPDWPQHGAINFVNFSTRYRPDLDFVLHNINLDVQPSEKVGLVGRTGSGKSTLTLSMFRIVEAVEGDIMIDDVAISRIGLHDLRSKLTIIPQDPVLFCGSLRLNLDPKGEHTDDEVWAALDKAHLKAFFQNKADKLHFHIEEDGQNLSVGQHQLICLARALLRNTKLLVLDEATASVDPDTDALVQQTIRRDFAHCTVLTVAHRLQTILDANRIVVMRSGKIEEIGAPGDLLRNPKSAFYAMSKEAGIVGDDQSVGFERGSSRHSTATP
ncbi:multidrug resistance-associated protein 1-like [Amblyomma americanum]